MHHPVHRFIDGPIAAENQNQIGALGDGAVRDFGRIARTAGRRQARPQTHTSQRFGGTLKNTHGIASEFAGGGIVDQDRLLIRYDS
jgi:hypothetical protein